MKVSGFRHIRSKYLGGFTLLEVLVALSILAMALALSTNSFIGNIKANHEGQMRFEGVQAAQNVVDELRFDDVANMPTHGTDARRVVQVESGRSYDVYVTYCSNEDYCTSDAVRHLALEVRRDGDVVYRTETVFTELDKSQTSSSSSSAAASSSSSSVSSSPSSSSASSVVSSSSSSSSRSISSSSSSSRSSSSSSSSSSRSSSSSSSSRSSSSSSSSSSSERCRRTRC